jgi:adhesin HecA-like repeat protein
VDVLLVSNGRRELDIGAELDNDSGGRQSRAELDVGAEQSWTSWRRWEALDSSRSKALDSSPRPWGNLPGVVARGSIPLVFWQFEGDTNTGNQAPNRLGKLLVAHSHTGFSRREKGQTPRESGLPN